MNRDQMIPVVKDAIDGWAWTSDTPVEVAIVDALIAAAGDEDAVFRVRKDAPATSKAIVEKVRSGTLQEEILHAFVRRGQWGATDYEVEALLNRSHQSVSATRNTLERKGYLARTDNTRRNQHGNDAIVFVWTGKEQP